MAKSIGSSSGFLTFVDRKAIPVDVSLSTMLYGLTAVVIALMASLIPAIQFTKQSIVGLKQQMARTDKPPLSQRGYLDILLLGLSAYGWFLFNERQFISLATGMGSDQLQVQPLLFFVPALCIFSLGLFFLRTFPWLLRLFKWMGRNFLPVALFLTLIQLSRSAKAYYPLMLLLILTLGLGVYNSSVARTIDLNSTERVLYEYGTDIVLQSVWEGYSTSLPSDPSGGGQNPGGNPGQNPGENLGGSPGPGNNPGNNSGEGFMPPPVTISYVEPPFQVFKELEGVIEAARVLRALGNIVVSGRSTGQGMVMGIDNVDFSKVAWFDRMDLYPDPPFKYLNLLGYYEQAVIIPSTYAEQYHLKEGDLINISLEQQSIEFVVVGILPYWPSQYPK